MSVMSVGVEVLVMLSKSNVLRDSTCHAEYAQQVFAILSTLLT